MNCCTVFMAGLLICSLSMAVDFVGGTGDPNDPYQIATAEELMAIDDDPNLLDQCYILVDDIDLDPNLPGRRVFTWAVIAPDKTPYTRFDSLEFNGCFDGNGHVISNLTIVGEPYPGGCFLGLFGRIEESAEIFDLGLHDVHIEGVGEHIGALVGEASRTRRSASVDDETFGDIRDCYSTGTVRGKRKVGGLVGEASRTVRNCYSTARVIGSGEVGGLVGSARAIVGCYSTGPVRGIEQVGGLAGYGSTVTGCYSTGSVDGENQVGGLTGTAASLSGCSSRGAVQGANQVGGVAGHVSRTIVDCNSTGTVSGVDEVGGLVGRSFGSIDTCRSDATVTGEFYVGGLAGKALQEIVCSYTVGAVTGQNRVGGLAGSADGEIRRSYSAGPVGGHHDVGGLVGHSTAVIMNCYSTNTVDGFQRIGGLLGTNLGSVTVSVSSATVLGSSAVGGLVGSNLGDVACCYSVGPVEGAAPVGGLVGENGGAVTRSFWDVETSGMPFSQGGVGLASAEMQTPETFLAVRWDLAGEIANGTAEIWWMPARGSYPQLSVFSDYEPVNLPGQGIAEDPFVIADAGELGSLWFHRKAHVRLGADIDLTGIAWSRAVVPVFEGTLDGNDYAVRHLRVEGGDRLGVFGVIRDGAQVHHLEVRDVAITGTGDYVGALAGKNDGHIDQCFSTGTVTGVTAVGGLAGLNERGITLCHSTALVSGHSDVGGLVGDNRNVLQDSFGAGSVSGEVNVGGLAGHNFSGYMDGCHHTGTVQGQSHVGGLAGSNHSGDIQYSYNAGTVQGIDHVGGLVGTNTFADVHDCYSTAPVEGEDTVGGLVGENRGDDIRQCYSVGPVVGVHLVGGLAGSSLLCGDGGVCAENSFWDTEASGVSDSRAGVGRTTAQMHDIDTFLAAGWDFVDELPNGNKETWQMSAETGYPVLTRF